MEEYVPETPLLHAASYALMHVAAGVATGATLTLLLPPRNEDETTHETLGYAALQATLNGLAAYGASRTIGQGDPTAGVVFLWALMASQPAFTARLVQLSTALGAAAATHAASAWPSSRAAAAPPHPK